MNIEQMFALKIMDVMQKDVVTVTADTTVYAAIKAMATKRIGAVVVLNDQELVVGIFTERDLLLQVTARDRELKTTIIKDVMTENPVVLHPKLLLTEAFALFKAGNFRHVPIVDKHKLVGIISVKDVNKLLYELVGDIFFGEKNNGPR
ncbi:MAG: CBS domain-containing protein [Candidatus Omnitrophica bacterium]|nr:CBS domain-containing protein [Candidatus Omnitrophota bacterium]MDD5670625.1 CBS domain-containing protein [Candidatus Omnitrophota bacterium]